jgi:hypothetical protein
VNKYLNNAIILAVMTLGVGALRQNETSTVSECLPKVGQRDTPIPERSSELSIAFQAMYNLEFGNADESLSQFILERPSDPLGPAAQAASALFSMFDQQRILQGEFFTSDKRYISRRPVIPDENSYRRFEHALKRSEELAKQSLVTNGTDEGSLFALTLVYGLRADYTALIERRDVAAVRYSKESNEWARKLLSVSPKSYDAYVATGIQQYLVGIRPAPIRWILRLKGVKGDRDAGIRDLELAACKGRYLAPFAGILLAIAHMRKNERPEAIVILKSLRQQFPRNPLFEEEIVLISTPGTP